MQNKSTFFEVAAQLDELIPIRVPTSEQVEEVLDLVRDEALERYFFKHLAASGNPG